MKQKIPLKIIIFISTYTLIFIMTLFMIIWQKINGFMIINQILLILFALICLMADIFSIKTILNNNKGDKN